MQSTTRRYAASLLVATLGLIAGCGGGGDSSGPSAPPAAMVKHAGDGGSGTSGQNVTTRPAVKVTDSVGNPVGGVEVTFAVTGGNGHATGTTQTTNSSGIATVGTWMLGQVGANTMSAVLGALPAQTFTVTASAPTSNYSIDVRYVGTPPASAIQAAFTAAKNRWQQIVVGDLANVTGVTLPAGSCGQPNFPAMQNESIDDILIFAEIGPIDGEGQVLGQASPCFVRTNNRLTVIGYMLFDSADLATMVTNGTITEVVIHEMGHVLGFGTLWGPSADNLIDVLTTYDTLTTANPRWKIAGTNNWFSAAGGTGGAPAENCAQGVPAGCGEGTRLAHWREWNFANELMTGYISASSNPISRVTVGALADMGYTVNLGAADAFTMPTAGASFRGGAPRLFELKEKPHTGPIIQITTDGRFVRRIR